jgi:predicted nucleotidyltransferase
MVDASPLDALRHAAQTLNSLSRSFALVGGLAVSVRSEIRFTRDVDLAVAVHDDVDAEQLIFQLGGAGYRVLATVEQQHARRMATARLRGPSAVVVDLLLASSGIEPEVVEHARPLLIQSDTTLPVACVEDLVALKVLSAADDRPQDAMDLQNLVLFNPQYDEDAVRAALELIQTRGYARGQDLVAKYEWMLAAVRR